MHRKTRHILLLLLAFNVLTGSVGMAATQRFCAMLGMAPSAAAAEKMEKMGCCKAKKKTPVCPTAETTTLDKTPCCTVATTFHTVDVAPTNKLPKVEFAVLAAVPETSFLVPFLGAQSVSKGWPLYSDSSPPLAGIDLLHRLHILNI
ncbi:hypothetical protein [Rufibacter sp. LB8]|uniref:hypothetical protein n=1 Tax=Rufibacter sp. LB8 TaxID=2777781 RepID=UPI00178C4D71|nr:hypothetical protein [Rufibacter sp. LB8]